MKKFIFLFILTAFAAVHAGAQKLVTGEKAPELKVGEWMPVKPSDDSRARLVEFFHSSGKQTAARIAALDIIARRYGKQINVILISKEASEVVNKTVSPADHVFYTAVDDNGKTFDSFGIQFVPFSVVIDKKGRVVWFGNPVSLDETVLDKLAD